MNLISTILVSLWSFYFLFLDLLNMIQSEIFAKETGVDLFSTDGHFGQMYINYFFSQERKLSQLHRFRNQEKKLNGQKKIK